MRKVSKILFVVVVMLMIVMTATSVFAATGTATTGTTGVELKPENFEGGQLNQDDIDGIQSFGQQIVAVVRVVGVLVAVVILLVLGIKYMIGSAEEKADYKKSMIPYLVGAVLIFAASAVTGMVYDMAMALNKP